MEERMNAMEKWADSAEQESRNTNLIIRGLTNINGLNEQELVTNIATTLSRKLEMKLTPEDIKYAIKIGKNVNDNHKPVKVVFHDRRTRDFIFRKRGLLKGTNIWLGEDLTTKRSKLAYQARIIAKKHDKYKTWTFEGKVYFKMADDDEPTRIDNEADLPTD